MRDSGLSYTFLWGGIGFPVWGFSVMSKGSREVSRRQNQSIECVLGYLNFSSGAPDPQVLRALDELFQAEGEPNAPRWPFACMRLEAELDRLADESAAFADASQAKAVLELLREQVLPGYLQFHKDLLFHQEAHHLLSPFFVGRAGAAVLQEGPPWDETTRIRDGAIRRLNNYIGYRPVPTLETHRHEPYPHEWVSPVPIYVRDAGVERGLYGEVVSLALEILADTDPDILEAAQFDPDLLDELAFDPRAYDFDHPVNKRPNYHFGQWDPHQIDQQGRYRRFVLQEITLDGLCGRVRTARLELRDLLRFEAAAVLAGTMLMASGICGRGPGAYDSGVTLVTLLPVVAGYRDEFYNRLIGRAPAAFRQDLERQAEQFHQPLGGARKHLNAWLAQHRASQLQHVHLAKIFARMGHSGAAIQQATIVPVASARMLSFIDSRLTDGHRYVREDRLDDAIAATDHTVDLIHRAIQCGAIVDPWNILGFDAQFSLFPALENSVHDHRVDQLIGTMERLFGLYSRIWSSAAADDQPEHCACVEQRFRDATSWWRQFAAHEVSAVDAVDGMEAYQAARNVAEALGLWHQGGAGAGDVKFWAPHAHMFDSPKAFALVIESLLDRADYVASMALLIQWLSQSDKIPLQQGSSSFHELAQRWLLRLLDKIRTEAADAVLANQTRQLIRKFFDYLEANAGPYWRAPTFQLGVETPGGDGRSDPHTDRSLHATRDDESVDDEEDDLFGAAYEGVVYRDSTDDGIDGELFDFGAATNDEFATESRRIVDHLTFLSTVSQLWKLTSVHGVLCGFPVTRDGAEPVDCIATMHHWVRHALTNYEQLLELVEAVQNFAIPLTGTDPNSLLEYDRQRVNRDSLLEQIVLAAVDTLVAARSLLASIVAFTPNHEQRTEELIETYGEESTFVVLVMAAMLRGDDARFENVWDDFLGVLEDKSLLYIPLAKGGDARELVAARCRQRNLQELLSWLPRRGFWVETCDLIEMARYMETENPVGPGAVTEFDELFKLGYRALVDSLVTSAESWRGKTADQRLVKTLEELTEILLGGWLEHSRTLRLSVLEAVNSTRRWNRLVEFIQRYGADLFSQAFLQLSNLRAILQQGVDQWLEQLQEDPETEDLFLLLRDLGKGIERAEAVEHLTLIMEAIVENFGEYRDYNGTTTQSDRGDMLYCLLDFLRLRTQYDRVSWHLKPVILAHEILVRRGHIHAAELWRRTLVERIGDEAERYIERLGRLEKKHAMRMSTVADRFAERFVRPMVIDRVRALVQPAMDEAYRPGDHPAFDLLEEETAILAGEATGIGFDVPVWLISLEEEVDRLQKVTHRHNYQREILKAVPAATLSYRSVREQLRQCAHEDDEEES